MPKRQNVKTIDSSAVQGEGSYVVIKRMTYGEARAARDLARRAEKDKDEDAVADAGQDMIANHLMTWNWVDDEGNPLPLPRDDRGVFDRLTDEEVLFLGQALNGTADAQKKLSS